MHICRQALWQMILSIMLIRVVPPGYPVPCCEGLQMSRRSLFFERTHLEIQECGKGEEKMAKEKKLVQSITSRDEDFAQWYTDVVREAKLCDYSGVKGCLNYLPNGYALWENIQADLDKRFKDTGVENVYLPVLIPESLLQKEKDHIEGFAPEVAWVTHGGMEPLQERFCIRPTSETLFCDVWSKTVQSYRDLPKVWNQ